MGGEISEMTTFTSEDRQVAQKEMNNKPIAWIWSEDGCNMGVCLDQDKQIGKQEFQDYSIPLYTHPVKEQELLGEIAQLKHMNKNWAISEGWLLKERDKLKAELDTANKAYMWMDETYKGNLAEIEALKAFVKPILAHGDECVGDWDGGELQDLAVKSGLYIEKTMTEPCNLGKEEFVGCPCREYCYGDESWECYRIADFLLEDEK